MDRRTFLSLFAAAGGSAVMGAPWGQAQAPILDEAYVPPEFFPPLPPIKKLVAVRLPGLDWHGQLLFSTFQGMINRIEPRLFYIQGDNDEGWLKYYRKTYGIPYTTVEDPWSIFERFKEEIAGYIVYDDAMLETANVATTLGSLENAVPVSPVLAEKLAAVGMVEVDNLVGRFTDRYAAYRWAIDTLLPRCNQHLLGSACTDLPQWPSNSIFCRDFFMAHQIFTFDLSACPRDRLDHSMWNEICEGIERPGIVMGWRGMRNNEQDYVQLCSRQGLYQLCCLGTRNLTIHAAIPKLEKPFKQKHITKEETRAVEDKVYIAFMNTDGDALFSMLRMQSGRLEEDAHGCMPYTFGFLPLAYDLMPGVARRNYAMKHENDYFAGPTSGMTYTYPHLHPKPRDFLKMTRHYMNLCDERVLYVGNWNREEWWQEVEAPGFIDMLREELPECTGFLRGMGESAFEPQVYDGKPPYIFCGEGIHAKDNVYKTITDFVDAVPTRPLFIMCFVNHSNTMQAMKEAVDRFPPNYEIIRMDEFIHLSEKAVAEGKIPANDFYPEKAGIRKILAKEARAEWDKTLEDIVKHASWTIFDEDEFKERVEDEMLGPILENSATPPGDIVAFTAVWDSMQLVRVALNVNEIYVNNKAQGVQDFKREFSKVPDVEVCEELWTLWVNWFKQPIPYTEARQLVQRLEKLARAIAQTKAFA